jgi:hypothetical protein
LLARNLCQTQPELVWSSLEPEQQQTVFRTIVMICRSLLPLNTQASDRKETSDE